MTASLDFRRDGRTEKVCAHDIEDYTEREHYWSIALRIDFNAHGMDCDVADYGVDGSGTLIRGKLPNYNADKKFTFADGKEMLIEVKTAPEGLEDFFTFKVFCLKKCVEQNALVCVPQMRGYHLFEVPALKLLLDKKLFVHKIYRGFSPNDPAVRIWTEEDGRMDMQEMLAQKLVWFKRWSPEATQFNQNHKEILTRERQR